MTTITTAQATALLETVLFESATMATANAPGWIAQNPQSTGSILAASTAMANSAEAGIAQQVIRYYQAALNRSPGAVEIQYYVNIAEQGLTAAQLAQGASAVSQLQWNQIAADFTNSKEFQTDFSASGTDSITFLYQNILHRSPAAVEMPYYQGLLANGVSVTSLMQDFSNSPEYQTDSNALITASLAGSGVIAATGGHPAAALGGATVKIASTATSLTEGGTVTFTINTTGIANGTILDYSLGGVSASSLASGYGNAALSGAVTVANGIATLNFALSGQPNQNLSGNLTLSITLPGYNTGDALATLSVPLTETSVVTLTADPTTAIAAASGATSEILVNYANPTASSFSKYVSGFQTLGIGSASTGSFDLASLAGANAAIDVTANLAGGNVKVINTSANQLLSIDSSITSENQLTLQMSSQAAAAANPTLTINLTPGVDANISHLTDTVTLGGSFTPGDKLTWTVDSQTLTYTVAQGDTAASVATNMAAQMLAKLDNGAPVYAVSATGNAISVSGGFWQNSMIDTISATGSETAAVTHTVTTTSVNAPGYTTLAINTGNAGFNSEFLQINDPSLTHLTLSGSVEVLLSAQTATLSYIDASHYTANGLGLQAQYAASGFTFIGSDAGFQLNDTNLASGATATVTVGNGSNQIFIGNYTIFANSAHAVVTVGNGYNYINLSSTNGTNAVTAGSGQDTIILGMGMNSVTLAAHTSSDTIQISNMPTQGNYTTITGLLPGDTVQLVSSFGTASEIWANGSAAAAHITTGSSLAGFISAATAITAGTTGVFSWFQFAGNTYVLEEVAANTAGFATGYSMVELTGIHDLSTSKIVNHALVL